MAGGSLAERRDRHQRRGAHDWRSLTNPAAISSPSGASQSRLGGQVRLDAGAAVFPQAVQAVAVAAAPAPWVVQAGALSSPWLDGLGRECPRGSLRGTVTQPVRAGLRGE